MTDTITTTHLAAWFGYTNAGTIKRLKKAGLTPTHRGPRGASEWDRPAALKAMRDTPKQQSFANYSGVVYAGTQRTDCAQNADQTA